MAWFADLSPCTYFTDFDRNPVRAIGWLERGHEFAKGRMTDEVHERLQQLQTRVCDFTFYRGLHVCSLCRQKDAVCNSSIIVPGDRVLYAAPMMLLHYVDRHGYLPPVEFCDAVIRCPMPGTPAYQFEFLNNGGRELLFWLHLDDSRLALRSI